MIAPATQLMFQGTAGEALALYAAVFPDFEVTETSHYGPGETRAEGLLKEAQVSFAGHALLVLDSPIDHAFGFTPAMSLFVAFEVEETFEAALAALSDGGEVLMPAGAYGFSRRYAWIADRFGVSWQLNLP